MGQALIPAHSAEFHPAARSIREEGNPAEYRKLGTSDLRVSEISLGSWLTYGVGVERDRAAQCVNRAFELGINFIDTANVYARGTAESLLGEMRAGRPRNSYVLATKVFFPMSATDRGLSRAQILKQIDASLKRLRRRRARPIGRITCA